MQSNNLKTKSLEIHFLHSHVQSHQLQGRVAVPIDVLRANTTMTAALFHGAKSIHPFETVEEATEFRAEQLQNYGEKVICGGERGGEKIDGFDFGNSPFDYTAESVGDRMIAFTTTNGTKTIKACHSADQIILGSFVNLTSVANRLTEFEKVALVCAGTNGEMTSEDILFAGAIAESLCNERGFSYANTQSHLALNIARTFWQTANRQIESDLKLADVLKMTQGGKNLVELGYERDIEFAAQIDKFKVLPILTKSGIVLSTR